MIFLFLLFLFYSNFVNSFLFDPFNFIRNNQIVRIEDSNVIIDSNKIPLEINDISKEIKESIVQLLNEEKKDFFNNWNEFLFNNIKNEHIIDKLLETNIDPQVKKEAIIKLLDITLIGDEIASNFLHIYQEFVRHIM